MRIAIGFVLASSVVSAAFLPSAQSDGVTIESGVTMKTRDGVALVADVYRPSADGRYPTLLQRTPYDRRGGGQEARELAAAGYVVITQDVRGRFDSQGEFYPFQHESEDGYDAVEWAAALPYSNGQVGMWGGSCMSGQRRCWPPWPIRPTSSPFSRTSPRPSITRGGPTSTAR
jgi:predicted acyl esterase